mmetsp:Transcript_16307/g.51112  ORF Transcript_16307/g.51112 Transcript_16307/m.51112 type:complete len:454 (-) Transcript_16307:96-1457(-)
MQRPSLAFALSRSQTQHIEVAADGSPCPALSCATAPNTPHSRATATPHSRVVTPTLTPVGHSPANGRVHMQASTRPDCISVIAPGGGTGINGAVYAELGRDPRFRVDIVGQSRAPYDCYPETWAHGGPAPNLASFAQDVLNQGVLERTDCLVCGSRGGQVVLPHFWQMRGRDVPPAVVLNGGIAMNLPTRVSWPDSAVTFLMIGGQDNFRGQLSCEEYVMDTKSRVPPGNGTTAILYVEEMQHMPQSQLLSAVLPHLIRAVLLWKADRIDNFLEEVRLILRAVSSAGWHGRLLYTRAAGVWEEIDFSPYQVGKRQPTAARMAQPQENPVAPIEHTRKEEMKALWRAAVRAAQPGGGVPLANEGARFAAAATAAKVQAEKREAAKIILPAGIVRGENTLMIPVLQAGSGRPRSPADPTPISRALGLRRAACTSPTSAHSRSPISTLEMVAPIRA